MKYEALTNIHISNFAVGLAYEQLMHQSKYLLSKI